MNQLFLSNEGTVAVGAMAVALAVAFLGVVGLGAYVLYCDALNRAGERHLVAAGEGEALGEVHAAPSETLTQTPPPVSETSAPPARRRRPRPPHNP